MKSYRGHLKKIKNASQAHQSYYNAAGQRVPGTTTITGVLDKPALPYWANTIGLQGIAIRDYVDALARIGTCGHYLVECYYRGTKPDLGAYTGDQIDLAKVCLKKFFDWQDENHFEPLQIETDLVSEQHQYGGRMDLYGILHGKKTLLDIKTSKAIYPEHFTQVAGGYRRLARENGMEVEDVRILRIGRDDKEGFECLGISPALTEVHDELFLLCRKIYELKKKVNKK